MTATIVLILMIYEPWSQWLGEYCYLNLSVGFNGVLNVKATEA
jgi:hypothetical protein